jgi:hypothetical protein
MSLTESSHKNIRNARGFILAMLLLVLVAGFHLMLASNQVKVSLQIPASEEGEQAKMQRAAFFCQAEQLALSRYLFNGDIAQLEQLDLARHLFHGVSPDESRRLEDLDKAEDDWYRSVAQPLIAQRQALDAGHGTIAQLEAHYLQVGGTAWEQRLDQLKVYTAPELAPGTFERLRQRVSESMNIRVGFGIALCFAALLVAIAGLRCVTHLEEALQEP